EAFVRLARQRDVVWQNRSHLLALAATEMRRILTDYGKRHGSQKRGGDQLRVSLVDIATEPAFDVEIIMLDAALDRLAALDKRQAQVAELRYFAGMSVPEAAEVLGVSPATVKKDWTVARAWLHRELTGGK